MYYWGPWHKEVGLLGGYLLLWVIGSIYNSNKVMIIFSYRYLMTVKSGLCLNKVYICNSKYNIHMGFTFTIIATYIHINDQVFCPS